MLVVGDGITEGTRRIGEYLRDQPGLAFGFGLIEIAEYRWTDSSGADHNAVQPRILARAKRVLREWAELIEREVAKRAGQCTEPETLPRATS